jgi:hypothetical protein
MIKKLSKARQMSLRGTECQTNLSNERVLLLLEMRKRSNCILIAVIAFLSISLSFTHDAEAARKKKAKEEPQAVSTKVIINQADMAKMLEIVKKDLDNTEWQITIRPMSFSKEEEVIQDILKFKNGEIESEWLVKQGFLPTTYSINIKSEALATWETMQSSEQGDMIFLKGEKEGDKIRGVISWRINDIPKMEYSFFSVGKQVRK